MLKSLVKKHILWYENKFDRASIDSFAASAAFFTVIALIPFVLFTLAVFSLININGDSLLQNIIELLPSELEEIVSSILLTNIEPVAILSLSALTSLWSSSKAMLAFIKGINSVFSIKETRSSFNLRLMSVLYTFSFVIILAASTIVLLFGNIIIDTILDFFSDVPFAYLLRRFLEDKSIWAFIILSIFFSLSFRFIPKGSNTKYLDCFLGACFATLGWIVFSFGFSFVLTNFVDYTMIYGNFAAVVVLMFWLYFCIYILLLGAQFTVWLKCSDIKKDLKNILSILKKKLNK